MFIFIWNVSFFSVRFKEKKKGKGAPHFDSISYKALVTEAITVMCGRKGVVGLGERIR